MTVQTAWWRVLAGMVASLLLIAADSACWAAAPSPDCASMGAMPQHHDTPLPADQPNCAIGCGLAAAPMKPVAAPLRVIYPVEFSTAVRVLVGITTESEPPPPRG